MTSPSSWYERHIFPRAMDIACVLPGPRRFTEHDWGEALPA